MLISDWSSDVCSSDLDDSTLPNWERWLAAAGVAGTRSRGPTLSHGSLTIEAALRGEGVALGRSVLVAEDVAAGRLVEPFPQIRQIGSASFRARVCQYV